MKKVMFLNKKKRNYILFFSILLSVTLFLIISHDKFYRRQVTTTIKNALNSILSVIYRKDLIAAESQFESYTHGSRYNPNDIFINNISDVHSNTGIRLISSSFKKSKQAPLFIYSACETETELLTKYHIDTLITNSTDELEAIIKLSTWVGTLWDHGDDPLPQKNPKLITAADLVAMGKEKKKFWCEIAAIMNVKAFSSLCWPARLISLSRTGYNFEHAVAEVWSNKYNKWIMIDSDFNIIYSLNTQPLSSFELCHFFDSCHTKTPDTILLGQQKPSLPYIDLLPFFNYVLMDLRNDWEQRILRPGSPAGGDLATIWTSRYHTQQMIWPGKRVDCQDTFDWKLNNVELRIALNNYNIVDSVLSFKLTTYSPYFSHFLFTVNDDRSIQCDSVFNWPVGKGVFKIKAQVITKGHFNGPIDSCIIEVL